MTAAAADPSPATPAERVRIYEVGPRDGLQNEANPVPLGTKLRYLEMLADAGLREIEATSFVAPSAIPQLADADELMAALPRRPGVRYPVLVPNLRGLARAEAAGVDAIAVFTAATDAFTTRN
ncbi:MAG TPA: hydroxymethylglutaryl-CoA lyase, partial [Verrucomicrobiae bacterium]|nr:hydroxymethylglutaryl-CoA lyase [Verrucomicrobiae bacterium]